MIDQIARAKALADKITLKASETLDGLQREMDIMKWPPEFRAIMWGAVADEATRRERKAKS
jgi:hypothetical protein